MTEIINLIRGLVEDMSTKGKELFLYDNETVFTLTESNLVSASVVVYINGVSTSLFSVNYDDCKVTITASLTSGDSIEIRYSYYSNYSDVEIKEYINSALSWLSVCKYRNENWDDRMNDFIVKDNDKIVPTPNIAERRLIALIASVLIKPNISYRTPDFSITVRDSEPKEEKIRKIIKGYKSRLGTFSIIEKEITD